MNKKITTSLCGYEVVLRGIREWGNALGISFSQAVELMAEKVCAPEVPELEKFFELRKEINALNTQTKKGK